jgi:hypothetical protein
MLAGAEEFGVDAAIPVGAAERLEQRPDLVREQLAAPSGGAGPAVEPTRSNRISTRRSTRTSALS